ncbi:MAG: alkaline phosphatase [Bacteroidales bacterium]|nr:alkaline phosphatase [Bacteroidales bacterium]
MKLKKILVGSLSLLAAMGMNAATPRYIFYFIGDGMGMGQVMAAQTYNRVALGNDNPLLMMTFPYAGMIETYSASGTVTDSAAAGTALATGHKTRNGMLGMDADSIPVKSMSTVLHDNGWGVALVTTVAPDDATPAAHYAHVPSRGMKKDIDRHAAESGFEFISGSQWGATTDAEGKPTDVAQYMKDHGIEFVTDIPSARESKSRRVFLYSPKPFNNGNVGFTIDSIPGMLTLSDMTATAINHMLKVSPEKFFMMVEGGNIDHAGHGNDGGTVAVEVHNFNKALAHAYNFYLQHPNETLIVVTADHETGGMAMANRISGYNTYTQYIPYQRMSKDQFSNKVNRMLEGEDMPSWDQFKEFTKENTGLWGAIPVKESQEKRLIKLYDDTFKNKKELADTKTLYSSFGALANEVYVILNENLGFGWTTGGHSGGLVPIYAIGEGLEEFGRVNDNTHIAPYLMKLAGVPFE